MKKSIPLLVAITILFIVATSCQTGGVGPGTDPDTEDKNDFIALHLDESYLSLLSINDDELEFTHLSDMYPYRYDETNWKRSLHQANGILGFTLHADLSDKVEGWTRWTGVWMDLMDGEANEVPLLNPCIDFGYDSGCNRFSFTLRNSVRIGTCGNIFYVAASQYEAGMWHEEVRYRLVRLDPQTGNYETSPLITPFTLAQPEIDPDRYGLARISERIFPSSCGQYVYGRTSAWGISGGNLIGSRGLLFRYDFDNEEFSRVDEVEYGFDPSYVTAENRHLLYYNSVSRQSERYDMQTGQVSVIEEASVAGNIHQTGVNNYGTAGRAYPLREIWYHDVVTDEIVKIPVPHNLSRSHQFSADGSYLYFRYDHEDNLLLRTRDLTEEAAVDTVAVLPDDVRVMTVLP